MEDPDLKNKWFDHWLQGARNGVEQTPPVNLYPIGGDAVGAPLDLAAANDADLHARATSVTAKTLGFTAPAAGRPGPRSAAARVEPLLAHDDAVDGRARQRRRARRTTAPGRPPASPTRARRWSRTLKLTGPIVANVWAELTSKDATLVSVLSDVAPSGESNQITAGFLLASQRAVDPAPLDVRPQRHPDSPVPPVHAGEPAARDAERPGALPDRDLPDLGDLPEGRPDPADRSARPTRPPPRPRCPSLADSLGGEIRVLHGGRYTSHVLLPVAPG